MNCKLKEQGSIGTGSEKSQLHIPQNTPGTNWYLGETAETASTIMGRKVDIRKVIRVTDLGTTIEIVDLETEQMYYRLQLDGRKPKELIESIVNDLKWASQVGMTKETIDELRDALILKATNNVRSRDGKYRKPTVLDL